MMTAVGRKPAARSYSFSDEGARMASSLNVVTGATGLVGGTIVEQLLARGERVRAITRPTSDIAELQQLGAEIAPVGLDDPTALRDVVAGAACVYHCAAHVSDWSAWREHQRGTIEVTRNLIEACRGAGVGRLLHTSTVLVYGHPRGTHMLTEDEPLGQRLRLWDYYCRAKIEAEKLVRASGLNATIVRPTWMYGPRDKRIIPRLMKAMRARFRVFLIGNGEQKLNMLHVADAARGAILAANCPTAIGEAYNLCSAGEISQKEMFDTLTSALGLSPIRIGFPYRVAYTAGLISELFGFAIRFRHPPHLTRHGVSLIGRPPRFRADKAREHFGWVPQIRAEDGLRETLAYELGKPL